MRKKIHQNKFFYFGAIFFLILLYYSGILKPVKSVTGQILKYPMAWVYSASHNFFSFFSSLKNNSNLTVLNQELNDKVIVLQQENINLKKNLEQLNLSREELLYLQQKNIKAISAKIISRGLSGNANIVVINQGKKIGLLIGMAVVAKNGLVIGKIINVEDNLAHVLLLTDSNSQISAAGDNDKSLTGILRGNFDLSLKLEYILRDKKINVDDLIITSGQEELVPAGLLIGSVDQIFEDSRELFKTARIVQPETVHNIDIVSVIMSQTL